MNPVLLLNAKDASAMLSVSRAHFLAMNSSGKIGPMPIKLGRRTLWGTEALRAWVNEGCPPRVKWLKDNGNSKR